MQSQRFRYFVLLASMRTGSNLFETNINSYDTLSCHGELFNEKFVGYLKRDPVVPMTLTEREHNPIALIDRLLETVTDRLPGFRLFDDHDPRVLDYVLADETCAKIILDRNPLDSFISLLIASETDQWKMSDGHKRIRTKVTFDPPAFETYLAEKKAFADHIRAHLQLTGQAAFRLQYEDLSDVDVFNGIAKYLGSSEIAVEFPSKMMRQNPEPVSEKVENYDELKATLKDLNVFEPIAAPYLEPKPDNQNNHLYFGTKQPLVFFPASSLTVPSITAWMQSHEPRDDNIQSDMNDRRLNRWIEKRPGAFLFCVLSDPLERLQNAFENLLLPSDRKDMRKLRKTLTAHYNVDLPEKLLAKDVSQDGLFACGYTPDRYQRGFNSFLDYLDISLKGQSRIKPPRDFTTQVQLLDNLSEWRVPDMVIRPKELKAQFELLENRLGLVHKPVANICPKPVFNQTELLTKEMADRIRVLYQRDYDRFGL